MKITNVRNQYENDTRYAPFFINSCGYYRELDVNMGVTRKMGRSDYQLIFVTEGALYLEWDGKPFRAPRGSVILFTPRVAQIYENDPKENSGYFWVHFNGTEAKQILDAAGFTAAGIYTVADCYGGVPVLQQIFSEIYQKQPAYQIRLMGLFCELLCIMCRQKGNKNQQGREQLRPALQEMEENPDLTTTVLQYARLCNMSKSYFLHSFKDFCGESPIQYRDRIVMQSAAVLLKTTDATVSQIAYSFGAKDALYFSKKFKKHYGLSPKQYRQST